MKKTKNFLLCCFLLSALNHCATTAQSNLEEARFALDEGDYQKAIDAATKAITADPNLTEAYRIKGDAQFSLSGIEFLEVEKGIVDLAGANNDFAVIATSFPSFTTAAEADTAMAHIRDAITTLTLTPNIDDADVTDNTHLAAAAFDLALMLTIDQYAIGIYNANVNIGSNTTPDVTGIDATDAENAMNDLIAFDDFFISSGIDETFVNNVRQVFWILENLSASEGFTTAEYQALVGCQLDPDNFAPATAVPTAGVADCNAVNPTSQSTTIKDQYNDNTVLE